MRRTRLTLSGLTVLALATVTLPAMANSGAVVETSQEIAIGKRIAPVPLTIGSRDPNSVYLGSYIVNGQSDCNGCHSNSQFTTNGNPFNGQLKKVNARCYLNGGQAFGPFVSRNLTPDATGKPAGITLTQFVKALRTGADPLNRGALLQVMPWPAFQNMTGTDLKAIYDYLSSIPSLPTGGSNPC